MQDHFNRQSKAKLVAGVIAVGAGAKSALTATKIATTPLDPLGLPKLPLRLLSLGVTTAVAAGAGAVALALIRRESANKTVRGAISPKKKWGCGAGP